MTSQPNCSLNYPGDLTVTYKDVQAMYERKLFSLEEVRDRFEAIVPELIS